MNDLNRKALTGLLQFLLFLAAFLFIPAWTLNYWQAWGFLATFSVSVIAITLYLMKNGPKLLERRMQVGPSAEKEESQKIIQCIALLALIAVFLLSLLDHRFGWSTVSPLVSVAGDLLVALGLLVIFFVFKENTYTSGVIELAAEQKVIVTGPYSLVRHPMYMGALVMILGIPIALGSWWGLLTMIPFTLVIA